MKYSEALEHKKEAFENADQSVKDNYHILIVPANTEESTKYIETFSKNPEKYDDESCKKFCSDDDYQVVSFKKEE